MRRNYTSVFIIFLVGIFQLSAWAAIPTGYYSSLNGKSLGDLKTATSNVVNTLKVQSMDYYYDQLPIYFKTTDVHPDTNPQQWWEMYSGLTFYVKNGMKGMNREHSFPKSWWGGNDDTPAYTDLNHLYPSEAAANMAKSNYPLGTVSVSTFDNGWSKVGYAQTGQGGGAAYVFEPADEYKGDFARTYFYMATCYQNLSWKYTYMVSQNLYPTLVPWAQELLLKWSREDPVSQKEINRNEAVYVAQGNRNPFIDLPLLAEYIWGTKKGEVFNGGDTPITGDPTLLAPQNGSALDFGETAIGKSQTVNLFVKGENLVNSMTVTLYGTDASYFKTAVDRISATNLNGADGYLLAVTYTPTSVGNHTAFIALSDAGITGSVIITLEGQALPVPTLSKIVATEATDITSTSYTANWNVPEGEVVDYYLVTRTVYNKGTQTTNTYDAETNSYEFTDVLSGTTESYSVQSVRLGYTSVPSNVINVTPSSVTGVTTEQGLAVINGAGNDVLFRCSTPHTNCQIFDMQGRVVKSIPLLQDETIINLPLGVYIVRTAELSAPIRIVIR